MTYAKSAQLAVSNKLNLIYFSLRVTCSLPHIVGWPTLQLKELMHYFSQVNGLLVITVSWLMEVVQPDSLVPRVICVL